MGCLHEDCLYVRLKFGDKEVIGKFKGLDIINIFGVIHWKVLVINDNLIPIQLVRPQSDFFIEDNTILNPDKVEDSKLIRDYYDKEVLSKNSIAKIRGNLLSAMHDNLLRLKGKFVDAEVKNQNGSRSLIEAIFEHIMYSKDIYF